MSIPAVKAACIAAARACANWPQEPETVSCRCSRGAERALLSAYVDRFNARDFDAIRDMLADEVRLDLVARARLQRQEGGPTYFTNYSSVHDWQLVPGFVDRRPALLVRDPPDPRKSRPISFCWAWSGIAS